MKQNLIKKISVILTFLIFSGCAENIETKDEQLLTYTENDTVNITGTFKDDEEADTDTISQTVSSGTGKFTFIESFESAVSQPSNLVNTVYQGTGGDGVYAIASWGPTYENRRVYINDSIVNLGQRSLKHSATRENSLNNYTGTESLVSPGPGDYDPEEGDEMWARMMIFIPEGTDWRIGEDGDLSAAEPKLFRVFWKSDRWLTTYLQISRGGSAEPDWYRNKYPTGVAVGIRYEVDHDNGPGPINYGASAPWSIYGSNSNFTYVASTDNGYENFIIPYGKWVSLEYYTYFSSDSDKGISRFWLDEKLVYEQTIDTWTSQVRAAPFNVVSILTTSTWQGHPTTETVYYTDDYIITNDSVKATKTDQFGNKMIGQANK